MNSRIIENAIEYIKTLFADKADGHDVEHTLRVYRNAMDLAGHYAECDKEIVAVAALLHDADDHKLFNTENNANARTFLGMQGIEPETIEQICDIINSVSFSKNKGKTPKSLEAKIVQDADRLDAIGAIGIARTFAYGGGKGRSLEAGIGHFHEKLLLLKDLMNTEEASRVAKERHAFMEQFLKEFEKETGSNDKMWKNSKNTT